MAEAKAKQSAKEMGNRALYSAFEFPLKDEILFHAPFPFEKRSAGHDYRKERVP
jgi:hypothetical protein